MTFAIHCVLLIRLLPCIHGPWNFQTSVTCHPIRLKDVEQGSSRCDKASLQRIQDAKMLILSHISWPRAAAQACLKTGQISPNVPNALERGQDRNRYDLYMDGWNLAE